MTCMQTKRSIAKSQQTDLLCEILADGYDFFSGVPDSCLKEFINGIRAQDAREILHIPATWEAEAIGLAAGAYLAGRKPCVYLQNSGLGFALNPLVTLCDPYNIPVLLVIGHRHSLPQHRVMGDRDEEILAVIEWTNYVLVDSGGSS